MDDLELALRGLSLYLAEFFQKFVDKGKEGIGEESQTKIKPKEKKSEEVEVKARSYDELTDLDKKIIEKLREYPRGISMRDLAKEIGENWQTVLRPMKLLLYEKHILKSDRYYGVPGVFELPVTYDPPKKIRYPMQRRRSPKMTKEEKEHMKEELVAMVKETPGGLTLPEMGAKAGRTWQSLKDLVSILLENGKLIRLENKKYIPGPNA